jgi:hypothetical protein
MRCVHGHVHTLDLGDMNSSKKSSNLYVEQMNKNKSRNTI